MAKATEVLARARAVLRERGWGRKMLFGSGTSFDTQSRMLQPQNLCALGAVYFAEAELTSKQANWTHHDGPAVLALAQAVIEQYPYLRDCQSYIAVYKFNDTHCKDVDELLHVMKRAEEIAAESEAVA